MSLNATLTTLTGLYSVPLLASQTDLLLRLKTEINAWDKVAERVGQQSRWQEGRAGEQNSGRHSGTLT